MKTVTIFVEAGSMNGRALFTRSIRGVVVQETERAVKVLPFGAPIKHTLWIPKRALKKVEGTYGGYDLASWFGRDAYAQWFIDRYAVESFTLAR